MTTQIDYLAGKKAEDADILAAETELAKALDEQKKNEEKLGKGVFQWRVRTHTVAYIRGSACCPP